MPLSSALRFAGCVFLIAIAPLALAEDAAAPASTHPDPLVDQILERLEQRDVRDLQAELTWSIRYLTDEEDEAQKKIGEIVYRQEKPVSKFRIDFSRKVAGGRADAIDEKHLFDGMWYVELQSERKQVFRKQIRREGEPSDPFKAGEGIFPLPFGQKKADMLKSYEVSQAASSPDDPPGMDHLKLKPKPGTYLAELYQSVDIWIARGGPEAGLPMKVRAGRLKGTGQLDSIITIDFRKPRLNQGLSGAMFELKTPSGFHEEVDPIRS